MSSGPKIIATFEVSPIGEMFILHVGSTPAHVQDIDTARAAYALVLAAIAEAMMDGVSKGVVRQVGDDLRATAE
jgi:hypothetical protein